MTTVPTTTISMSDLSSAFSLPNNLAAYYGARWYKENNSRGYFVGSGAISFSDFAGTRNTSPVSPGAAVYGASQNIPIPMFNNLTVTVKGGNGGTAGTPGNCNGGGPGGAGVSSYLTEYVSANGGSANGGTGATASTSLSITDANQSSILARYGTQPYGQVGGGGGAGATGYNNRSEIICTRYDWVTTCVYTWGNRGWDWYCADIYSCVATAVANYCDSATGAGSPGAAGYIRLDWS